MEDTEEPVGVNYTQLGRIMRQATQQARLRTLSPLVGYVGAAVDLWRTHGLVTEEEARAFRDALVAAGAELALAPQVVVVDPAAAAAKARVGARQASQRGPKPARAAGDAALENGAQPDTGGALPRVTRPRGR